MPGTVLGSRDPAGDKTKIPCPCGVNTLVGLTGSKQIYIHDVSGGTMKIRQGGGLEGCSLRHGSQGSLPGEGIFEVEANTERQRGSQATPHTARLRGSEPLRTMPIPTLSGKEVLTPQEQTYGLPSLVSQTYQKFLSRGRALTLKMTV